MTESMSYSVAFIFSFFMAGLTGYYFGEYFLDLEFIYSMMIALVFIIITIVVETSLFILKQYSLEARKKKEASGPKNNPESRSKSRKKVTKTGKDKKE